ncbi:unnamed protein product [Urochloa decumbens]|uniref:DUF4005 domain-containing protein n=1 Tax=Urochloa decumbens TaxID=240449 RepID=A0ABC9GL63_9POAL
MGRAMRWLKKVLTGTKKEGERDRKEHGNAACAGAGGGLGLGPPPVEKRRWSFAKPRHSVADGGKRPSVTAVAAGELSQVRPCNCGMERDVEAAVVIQKAFRGYLARKALRALKSLVKLQALVRGYLVRKQAATTLRRLQALMRLQAKTASSRKSVEQERIVARVKPVALPAVHRRRLSDGGDTGFDRIPRIVEMDTCQLRCLSSRITSRYAAEPPAGASSPLLYFPNKPASRLHGQWLRELEPPHPKTTHNTPRLGAFPGYLGSPAAAAKPPGRAAACRDAGGSPRYMADTASSVARTRCQSTPRQRQGEPRNSVRRSASRKQALDSFSFGSSETSRVEDSEISDEITRDYYLDRLW